MFKMTVYEVCARACDVVFADALGESDWSDIVYDEIREMYGMPMDEMEESEYAKNVFACRCMLAILANELR